MEKPQWGNRSFDVGDDASASLRITAVHQHARAGLPELASDEASGGGADFLAAPFTA
jgi:hypothetical protein